MATEDLSIDNILDQGDIDNLFMDNETQETQESQPENKGNEDNKETPEQEQTTEVNTDDLFVEPESVGSEENKEKEGTETEKESTSPNNNFYSSIAKTFAVESIFPDLTDDEIKNANSAEALVELINKQIDSRLDEKQQRVINALDAGIEPDDIRRYENTISYLDSIDEDKLNAETPEGEELRKRLIYQDYINRKFSPERANREVQRSIDSGNDITDAKEALQSNKEFFNDQYNDLLQKAKEEEQKFEKERKQQAEQLKKSIIEDKNLFGDLELNKSVRQKIFDNISKPVYKDEDSGAYITALQKYQKENPNDFLKNVSTIFTLTDGFKNIDKLVAKKASKEIRKGFRELENTFAVDVQTVKNYIETSERKSIPVKWIIENGIEIKGTKKKVRFRYDLESLFKKIENGQQSERMQ